MGRLAQAKQDNQIQAGAKPFAKGGAVNPFEKSKKDKETKGKGKEGSKKEESFDTTQMKKCGGKVKK